MQSSIAQLLVLAVIVVFLIIRLRDVLGTRGGYETKTDESRRAVRPNLEVVDGGLKPDADIAEHTDPDGPAGRALARMKVAEPSFNVSEFLGGARGAYEMILMAFERGELADIKPFLSDDVYTAFASVVESRADQGLTIDADFIGIRDLALADASYDDDAKLAQIDVRFGGELTYVVRDRAGDIIEGDPKQVKRQRDVWTFSRVMGSDDPNWQLSATGE